jgi:hypothetical protein
VDAGILAWGSPAAPCGTATVATTDLLVVLGESGRTDTFALDLSGSAVVPGATPETDGRSELEVRMDLGGGAGSERDRLAVVGSSTADTITVGSATSAGSTLVVAVSIADPRGPVTEASLTVERADTLELSVDGGDGDDVVSAASVVAGGGVPAALTLLGGPGADRLTGSGGADLLAGGPGADEMDGGAGGDAIDARDGTRDTVGCGAGADAVLADEVDDLGEDCERDPGLPAAPVPASPAAPTVLSALPAGVVAEASGQPLPSRAPTVAIGGRGLSVTGRRVRVPIRCPSVAVLRCELRVVLRTVDAVALRVGNDRIRQRIALGETVRAIRAGTTRIVGVRLTRLGRAVVRRKAPLAVVVVVTARDESGGQPSTTAKRFVLARRR